MEDITDIKRDINVLKEEEAQKVAQLEGLREIVAE